MHGSQDHYRSFGGLLEETEEYIMVRIEVLDKIVIEFVNKRCAPVHLRCSTGSEGFTIGCFNLARIDLGYYFHRPGVPALFYAIKCSLKKVERLHVAHES